jgi:hypothetical protein
MRWDSDIRAHVRREARELPRREALDALSPAAYSPEPEGFKGDPRHGMHGETKSETF